MERVRRNALLERIASGLLQGVAEPIPCRAKICIRCAITKAHTASSWTSSSEFLEYVPHELGRSARGIHMPFLVDPGTQQFEVETVGITAFHNPCDDRGERDVPVAWHGAHGQRFVAE